MLDNAVVEVKNTAKLSYTRQLHAMQEGAEKLQQKFELFVRPDGGTKLSRNLQAAIDEGKILLREIRF